MSEQEGFEKNENSRFADDDTFAHRVVKRDDEEVDEDAVAPSEDSEDEAK